MVGKELFVILLNLNQLQNFRKKELRQNLHERARIV